MGKEIEDKVGFVLLHGAGLGAWIWDDVLQKLSYPALAADFPGRGGQKLAEMKHLTLQDYVQCIAKQIQMFKTQRIIIVAHSISGIIGLKLAEMFPNRMVGFIAVGACIPPAKGSFLSSLPLANRVILRIILAMIGSKPPESVIRKGLCSDLSEAEATQVVERFVPESTKLYTHLIQHHVNMTHSLYIRLTEDREFGDHIQARMITNLQPQEVIDLASGHLPMLSRPTELASILNSYAMRL